MRALRLGRPAHVLVVAPHPDDETIGAFGLIRRLRARGARVRVLVITDGAGSHRGSARWPTRRLVTERRRETRRAMRGLGIGAEAIRHLGLPDGALTLGDVPAIRRGLMRGRRPDLIVGPAPDDNHADHRVTAAAIARMQGGARALAYPVWPAGRRGRGLVRLALGPVRAAKRRAIQGYRTQMGLIADDPAGFAVSPRELALFAGPAEHFREVRG